MLTRVKTHYLIEDIEDIKLHIDKVSYSELELIQKSGTTDVLKARVNMIDATGMELRIKHNIKKLNDTSYIE